jgi:hypothetical protein
MKSLKDRVLHLIDTEGKNGQYQVTSGLKSLAGELGVTHEALYRTLALLVKNKTIRRDEALLVLARKFISSVAHSKGDSTVFTS